MLYDLLQDEEFRVILTNHANDLISYLLEKGEQFGIIVDITNVTFSPQLPPSIKLPEFTKFLLVNYTFESAKLEKGVLTFEAGFGKENFGSVVSVPLESILQIVVDDTPIFINLTASLQPKNKPKSSLEALMSNPENERFLK